MTARILCSGTPKRLDASTTNAAKGWTAKPFGRRVVDAPCLARTAPTDGIDAASIAAMHIEIPRDRKPVIVLAAVKGEALSRRPNGRP